MQIHSEYFHQVSNSCRNPSSTQRTHLPTYKFLMFYSIYIYVYNIYIYLCIINLDFRGPYSAYLRTLSSSKPPNGHRFQPLSPEWWETDASVDLRWVPASAMGLSSDVSPICPDQFQVTLIDGSNISLGSTCCYYFQVTSRNSHPWFTKKVLPIWPQVSHTNLHKQAIGPPQTI